MSFNNIKNGNKKEEYITVDSGTTKHDENEMRYF